MVSRTLQLQNHRRKWTEPERKVQVGDLVFLRTHLNSDAVVGIIKKLFFLYTGPYFCCDKSSFKVVSLSDTDSIKYMGHQAEENCTAFNPSSETRGKSLTKVHRFLPPDMPNESNARDDCKPSGIRNEKVCLIPRCDALLRSNMSELISWRHCRTVS